MPNTLVDRVDVVGCTPAVANAAQAALADLRKGDGAKILAARVSRDVTGLEALLAAHGDLAIRAIRSVLTRAMIDGGQVGSIRSWAYFKPVIEEQRKAERLCVECGLHPRLGQLTRCVSCVRSAAQQDRESRAAAEARVRARSTDVVEDGTSPAKQCKTCERAKPLVSYGTHHRSKDGHLHSCIECTDAARVKRPAARAPSSKSPVRSARRAAPKHITAP
jgi:hypothetical protein